MASTSLSVAVVLVVLGCAVEEEDHHMHDELVPSGATCDSTRELTYQSFGRPFMAHFCVGCHASTVRGGDRLGAPEEHNFDTLELIRAQAAEIDGTAAAGPSAVNDQMPELGDQPSLMDRMDLGVWLACGAP